MNYNLNDVYIYYKNYFTQAILHLPNPDDKIAINVMSFLGILMLNGNESAQNKIFNIISDDSKFFIRTHRIISKLALHFGYKMKQALIY